MEKQIFGREKNKKWWLVGKNKYWVWKKMGTGKKNVDLDGQLTNFPGQTQ